MRIARLGTRSGNFDAGFRAGYQHPDLGDDNLPDLYAAADAELTQGIVRALKSDPQTNGPLWYVEVSHETGIVKINIPTLMSPNKAFVIKIESLLDDLMLRKVIKGCCELMERFNIPRTGFSEADLMAAIHKNPLGHRGKYRNGFDPLAK